MVADYPTYHARADAGRAQTIAATDSPFAIEVRFLGGLNQPQQAAFTAAADRWTRIVVGDLSSVTVDGEVIDDIVILAQGVPVDGPGQILGRSSGRRPD